MRSLYMITLLALLLGSFGVRAQSDLEFTQPEQRQDLAKSVQIYPIPAVEFVHVRLEHLKAEDVKVTLHNIIGNELRVESETMDEHTLRVKVKDLDAGYYLISLRDDQSKFQGVYKFLKR
jgi:hypothetical protein